MGTTKGYTHYIRGDRDPRLDACLTLKEVTKILIDEVLDHNSSSFDDLSRQTGLLIEAGLTPTPLNYWNIHHKKSRCAFNKIDEVTVRARLLPAIKISIDRLGIRLNNHMYYECNHCDFNELKTLASLGGNIKVNALIDLDNSSFIYVQLKKSEGYTRCSLMPSFSLFKARHIADIQFYTDWFKAKEKENQPTIKNIERNNRKKSIIENAVLEFKNAPPLLTKREGGRDMKTRRNEEILRARKVTDNTPPDKSSHILPYSGGVAERRKGEVIQLLQKMRDRKK
ncbi:hypothetical protein ACP3TB_07985 [Rahnella variigena]|uniref:hypothetical protein n=1 Tax=Rahnella variigena TaxID=574964 RepID=UPI003CF212E4